MLKLRIPKLNDEQRFWVGLTGWLGTLAVGAVTVIILGGYYKIPPPF